MCKPGHKRWRKEDISLCSSVVVLLFSPLCSYIFHPSSSAHIHNPTVHPTTVLGHPSPCSLLPLFLVYSPSVISQHPFTSLEPPFFPSSHLFESKVGSLRQVRTQKAFYLFILSLFPLLPSYLLLPLCPNTIYYTHMHPHTHTQHVKFKTCS